MKLWAILYLALRIHNQDIHLGDMIRYGREGHLSYYKFDHLIPPEVALTRDDVNFLSRAADITHKGMRSIIGKMAEFLGVTKIICPDFLSFIVRYCNELHLPRGISLYAERLVALSPPKMTFDRRTCIPNYEGRAIAFIIVVMKTLLGLDGITEYEISKVAASINSTMQCETFKSPCIFVHGETFDDELVIEKMMSCKNAASTGYQSLLSGASPVKAAETALWWLECDEFFNCGYGSVLNEIGDVQMDASIIDGSKLEYGSVAAVSDIEHPISLARYVLDCFPNSIIVGEGARQLAKYAELDWLSKGDMVAPAAYVAYKSGGTDHSDVNANIENQAEALKNGGSVGCIAYDGHSIAVGITSGGSNKKLVGSVSGSSIMGCGAYADRNVGCSLTGHEESIMKLGLSRAIASDIEEGRSPWKALRENLDYMLNKYNRTGGGVAFTRSGEWGIYFTGNRMPYAIIMDDRVTFGAALDEKNVERYTEYRKRYPAIDNEGICDFKLFNFREWQDYVECRRAVLVNAHYPTKLKHNPDVPDVNSLYIKYLESMRSKSDREEPEITTGHKHLIPRELVHAMKHCVTNIDYIDVPLNDVNEFSPSLTPHHSYLQQLLEHPSWDLPSILRNDFFSTKIGYMTKPDLVCKLAVQYNIPLDIIDSNLHFVEKIVPFFEQAKMANMKELKDNVEIQDCLEEDMETSEKKESFIEYLHKKIPCRFKIDPKKKQYYDNSCNRTINTETPPLISSDEFIFNEVLPNGKLAIPDEIGGDESEDDDTYSEDVPRETRVLTKFCKAYDIHFSSTEKKALLGHSRQVKKQKRKLSRNVHGKFVKQDDDSRGAENPDEDDCYEEQIEMVLADDFKVDSVLPEISDILNMNDDMSNRFDDLLKNEYDDQDKRHDEMFKLATDNSAFASDTKLYDDTLRLCRPFTDYWMYHCNFSRVKPKNFELFEKMLPRGFRWLLNECANVVEMSTEDLYEEVCLVEAYHAYLSEQFESCVPTASSNPNYSQNRAYVNAILKKW
ncbi:hypothetical protein DMN91_008477 [Ooceraea biroi]|uniref:Rrn7/TAF1B C-terminal cyclin domain-containing protein n=1 Tax=Ooceraea biroi TaxID=2015173 RepID=A0A3L8DJ88_OOCBI|nr:hypothetical protein DMN91_008477 [Ooceraea biroi]